MPGVLTSSQACELLLHVVGVSVFLWASQQVQILQGRGTRDFSQAEFPQARAKKSLQNLKKIHRNIANYPNVPICHYELDADNTPGPPCGQTLSLPPFPGCSQPAGLKLSPAVLPTPLLLLLQLIV